MATQQSFLKGLKILKGFTKKESLLKGLSVGLEVLGTARAGREQAGTLRRTAKEVLETAAVDKAQFERQASRTIGTARALRGASGIAFTGSPLAVDESTVRRKVIGERRILRQGEETASQLRREARSTIKTSRLENVTSLLGAFL